MASEARRRRRRAAGSDEGKEGGEGRLAPGEDGLAPVEALTQPSPIIPFAACAQQQ